MEAKMTFSDFYTLYKSELLNKTPFIRDGQMLMNLLGLHWLEEYKRITEAKINDCFYLDEKINNTLTHLLNVWHNRKSEINNEFDINSEYIKPINKMKTIVCVNPLQIEIVLNNFKIESYFVNDANLIIFNERVNDNILNLAIAKGIKYYGGYRLAKLYQYFLLNRLGIYCPKTYYNIHKNSNISNIDELNAFVDLDEFIVKPSLGARGIGVKKITRQEWKDCLINSKNVYKVFANEFVTRDNKELDPTIPIDSYNIKHKDPDIDNTYIEYSFKDFIIQEPIDVLREFRCLYFRNGEYLCYERVKEYGQFCGNLSHGSTPKIIDTTTDNNDHLIIKNMINNFEKILKETNYPWISIDLFTDNKGTGVFEFQMEFAYEGFDYKDVKRCMANNLNYLIDEKQ